MEPARRNLLGCEVPWLKGHAAPFWVGVPMVEGRALDVGEEVTEHALFRVVVRFGATFSGLWLRDGGLILKVMRGCRTAQIQVKVREAFDPAQSRLEIAVACGGVPRSGSTCVESLDATVGIR